MLAHDLVDRPTQDVDLFTPDSGEVTQLTDALAVALRAEGAQVLVAAVRTSAEKDAGFDRRVSRRVGAAAHSDAAFTELGLALGSVAARRASTAQWRAQLLDAAGMSATDAVQSIGRRTPPVSEALGSTSAPRPSQRHRPPPSDASRDGPSLSR